MQPFEVEVYKPDPERPGYLKKERTRTYRELFQYCERVLKKAGVLELLEYFDLTADIRRRHTMSDNGADSPLPERIKWIAVFAVTGGSEGYYIHVELITTNDDPHRGHNRQCVILGKELSNRMDTALKVVNVLAPLLS